MSGQSIFLFCVDVNHDFDSSLRAVVVHTIESDDAIADLRQPAKVDN